MMKPRLARFRLVVDHLDAGHGAAHRDLAGLLARSGHENEARRHLAVADRIKEKTGGKQHSRVTVWAPVRRVYVDEVDETSVRLIQALARGGGGSSERKAA